MNSRPAVLPSRLPSEDFLDSGFATISEYCQELDCSRPTLDRLISGGLPHVNIGTGKKRCIRIPRAAAMAWLRNRR
jgi:excisionase family DNA binding protein